MDDRPVPAGLPPTQVTFDRPSHRDGRRRPGSPRGGIAKLLLAATAFACAFVGFASAPGARAAEPCGKQIVDDWYQDARIDGVYPIRCYRQAIRDLPEDVEAYSSIRDDIDRALQQRIRGDERPRGSRERGGSGGDRDRDSGLAPGGPGGSEPGSPGAEGQGSADPQGPFPEAIDRLGPENADSVPLPLIILAGMAMLLLAAGAAAVAARKLQARRAEGAPLTAEPTGVSSVPETRD